MADSPSTHILPPIPRTNLETLYYGLIIVSIAATVLFIYNLVVLRWCVDQQPRPVIGRHNPVPGVSSSSYINYVYSYKHKKDGVVTQYEGNGYECAVCLSMFEEGEHLRQLPNCKHSFHANCIDMWLHSHMDCPLCRTKVEPERDIVAEHSHERMLNHETLV